MFAESSASLLMKMDNNKISIKGTGILIISDLHLTDEIYGRGANVSKFIEDKSFLYSLIYSIQTVTGEDLSRLKYLIVLGDLADFALGTEFEKAFNILDMLCLELSIKKENVLIVPGNHDIDREALRKHCYVNHIKHDDFVEYQDIKLNTFKTFYDTFYEHVKDPYLNKPIIFRPEKAITRALYIKEIDTIFTGFNTNYKESFFKDDHVGWINMLELQTELNELSKKNKGRFIIALMHHTVEPNLNTVNNWNDIEILFRRAGVKFFIGGHAHTTEGISIKDKEELHYLTCGSLSATESGVVSSYMIFDAVKVGNELKTIFYPFNYMSDFIPANRYWQLQSSKPNIQREVTIVQE